MAGIDDGLIELAKDKLNITWNDEGTNRRVKTILEDAIPAVCNMIGCEEDFDFSQPSMERNLLLNYAAYEWNHQIDVFRDNYWQEISALRKKYALSKVDEDEDGE